MYVLAELPSRVAGLNVCNDIHCNNLWLFALPPTVGSTSGCAMLALTSQSFDVTIDPVSGPHLCNHNRSDGSVFSKNFSWLLTLVHPVCLGQGNPDILLEQTASGQFHPNHVDGTRRDGLPRGAR